MARRGVAIWVDFKRGDSVPETLYKPASDAAGDTDRLLAVSVQDFIEGAEVGTAEAYVALESKGRYHAEKVDKAAGKVQNTVGGIKDSLRDH